MCDAEAPLERADVLGPPEGQENAMQGNEPEKRVFRRLRKVGDNATAVAALSSCANSLASSPPTPGPPPRSPLAGWASSLAASVQRLSVGAVLSPFRAFGALRAAAPFSPGPFSAAPPRLAARAVVAAADSEEEEQEQEQERCTAAADEAPARRRRLRTKRSLDAQAALLSGEGSRGAKDAESLADAIAFVSLTPPVLPPKMPPPLSRARCPPPPPPVAEDDSGSSEDECSDDDDTEKHSAVAEEPAEPAEPADASLQLSFTHASGARFRLSARLSTRLFAHQREGVAWLWARHCLGQGGILGDDMGLGKTFQVAAFLAGAFAGGAVNRALVVAPTTLLAQWEKELGACGMGARVHVYSGGGRAAALRCLHRTGGVLLTSYGMVLHNARALGGRQVTAEGGEGGWECKAGGASSDPEGDPQAPRLRWDWVVCDEGHKLKNPNMQLVARLSSLAAQRRLILTGTPVQNNLGELWALANFVAPGLLGDARTFRESYEKPVSRGTSRDASARERHVGAATAAALRAKLAPAFLRRDKRDVFQQHPGGDAASGGADAAAAAQGSAAAAPLALGRKTDMIVWLRLTPPQRRLYAAFLGSSSVAAALNKTRSALAAITVLKKICDHPGLLSQRAAAEIARGRPLAEVEDGRAAASLERGEAGACAEGGESESEGPLDPTASCKSLFVLAFVQAAAAGGHRTLVFSQSRAMLDGIQAAAAAAGHRLCRIDGSVPASERARLVSQFQEDPSIPLFLLTSAVGGLGLTLTGADRVLVVDPAWNPAADAQAVDRAYRLGQSRDVAVYRLITCGTVEEKIYRKQVFKAGLSRAGTVGGEVARYFTSGEMRDLFACDARGLDAPATALALAARHGPPGALAPAEVQKELAAVLLQPGVAAVTEHGALFTAPDESLPGCGEREAPTSRGSTAPAANPAPGGSEPPQRRFMAASTWRGGGGDGGVLAAALARIPNAGGAADATALAASRAAARAGDLTLQIQRYNKLLLDPLTTRLVDGGANIRSKLAALVAEMDALTAPPPPTPRKQPQGEAGLQERPQADEGDTGASQALVLDETQGDEALNAALNALTM